MSQYCLHYGETPIEYTVNYASRKTLAITVHPDDLRVTVTAPENTPLPTIEAKVRHRAPWILRQQRELELYLPHTPPRDYVSGETHRYLGRQYRLKLIQADQGWVTLEGGYLVVQTLDKTDRARIAEQVEGWYTRQAYRIFHEQTQSVLPRFARYSLPDFQLQVKKLEAQWGTCTDQGVITLNLKLLQVAKKLMDYVIVHELCHLLEHNHNPRFYQLLTHILPDWQERRRELNQADFS